MTRAGEKLYADSHVPPRRARPTDVSEARVTDLDQKVALAALAYGAMDVPELLDAIAYQERLLADPAIAPETREIAGRCLDVCRELVRSND
ncbi:hypothetical protein HRV97_03045 [Sphingomonas sp. HHU CXW]|uniref:Uncharacterized protein n=1 Tax=Sphingomonas hominis TaxID=2741495 RepID=A0ABX2JM03_9SPHN|nr:hypothetical protein [Sphingomonas hominis]NTS64137.1 hypothetical protein [Sphingomonas hominis]